MNKNLINRQFLIASDNDGIVKKQLYNTENYNTLWGPEYFIMNEKNFIDNNADGIIEIMVKTKSG